MKISAMPRKSKAQRARRRQERAAQERAKEIVRSNHGRYDVTDDALDHFEEMMDPTEREITEAEYLHLIADPEHARMVGVPLSLGGVPPTSVKIRVKVGTTMTVGPTGSLAIAIYGCQGAVQSDDPAEAGYYWDLKGNLLPKIGYMLADGIQYRQPIIAGGYLSGVLPLGNVNKTLDSVPDNLLGVPNPGLNFAGTVGRVVAQSTDIYPVGPFLTQQGIGIAVSMKETGAYALNGLDPATAFSLNNTQRQTFPLANWNPDHTVRFIRIPMEQKDVNQLNCDFGAADPVEPPAPGWNPAGPIQSAFFAQGCDPSQQFRVESTIVYEFINGSYAMSTENGVASSVGPEIAHTIGTTLNTGVTDKNTLPARQTGAWAESLVDQHGPKHATGFASILSKVGGAIGKVAKEALPSLLGLATSALSEGTIPPQVGSTIGREILTLGDKLSGHAPVSHAPLLLPSSSSRIEVLPDDYEIKESERITNGNWVVIPKSPPQVATEVGLSTTSAATKTTGTECQCDANSPIRIGCKVVVKDTGPVFCSCDLPPSG
jgi:hypothetical protein